MKKLISIACFIFVIISLSGCVSMLGGVNSREIGEFTYLQTDGEKEYFYYDGLHLLEDGYVLIDEGGYTLQEGVLPKCEIQPLKPESEVVLTSYKSALYGEYTCAKEYDYLGQQLEDAFGDADDDKYYEALLLKKNEEIFGVVNIYSCPSARSGNLLTYEQLIKSCFINVREDKISITHEYEDTAILAFNDTHALTYKDKKVYSKELQTETDTFVFNDKWWDRGPTYYNSFSVSFTDEHFLIYADKGESIFDTVSILAGRIDGTEFATIIDDKVIVF